MSSPDRGFDDSVVADIKDVDVERDVDVAAIQVEPPAPAVRPGVSEQRRHLNRVAHQNEMLQHDLDDRKQTRELRETFAQTIKWTLIGILAATTILMLTYMVSAICRGREIEASVMISWFSSMVVQVIGLMYIVANYLFPKGENGNGKS